MSRVLLIDPCYNPAYRRMVLTNPSFYWRRFWHGLRTGEFLHDLSCFLRFLLAGAKI